MSKLNKTILAVLFIFAGIHVYAGEGNKFSIVLSGTQAAPRVLACKTPEFSFHFPQMAGNFKLGIISGQKSLWCSELKSVKLQKKDGKLIYTIEDNLLKEGKVTLRIAKLTDSDGFVMEVEGTNLPTGIDLFWSFGGSYAKVLSDKTDSGLKPEYCKDNVFSVEGNAFTVYYGESLDLKVVQAVVPDESDIHLSDAHKQTSPLAFHQSGKKTDAPALTGTTKLINGKLYFCFYLQNAKADYNSFMLPELFKKEF
ncbi:DUF4450 domain-containing protein [uncultured Bacteroides sp.]|uniref:DUF4450 domain-containing protein n=1 Tax=uncultured Bacteroides sp. TaxID=162156 RepID=UPI002AA7BB2A|nr:DUF4450 domain-containing protein [uncultured Bacteroides sp.]